MKRHLFLAALLIFALSLQSCASREKAFRLCQEAYERHWGKDWDKVVELSTQAIETDPDLPWAYSQRGFAYAQKDMYAEAMDDLNMALELDPAFAPAYFNRGFVHYATGDIGKAIADYTMALDYDAADIFAYSKRAEAFIRAEMYEEAEKDLLTALDIAPTFTPAMVTMAVLKAASAGAEESCGWLRKAVQNGYPYGELEANSDLDIVRSAPCYAKMTKGSPPR
jgi:tetratricopeptide (TPR) repeat protein